MGKTRKIEMRSFKEYSEKDITVVDYTPGMGKEISYNAQKRKRKDIEEISSNKLGDYMRKSAADAGKPGATARQQDKRIGGQSMADKKIRKKMGYSSTAKVPAGKNEEVEEGKARDRLAKMVDKASGRTMSDRQKDAQQPLLLRKEAEKDHADFQKNMRVKEGTKDVEEGDGLWHNIHKKRKEGRPMRKPGSKGAPTKQDFKNASEKKLPEGEGETTPCPSCDGSLENHNPDCTRAGNSKTGKDVATANPKAGDQKDAAMAEDNTDEALNMTARRKKSRQMKRLKSRIKLGRERAKRKMADPERLKKRARKAARNEILKKLTKGVSKSELTYARRQELEKRLDKPAVKARIDRLSKKMLPATRRKELDRRRGGASDKK